MKFKFTLFCIGLLMACFIQQATAQTLQVSGTVKSKSTAEPLAGATVSAVGTAQATQTDAKGNFTIGVTKGSTLSISYTGFKSYKYVVNQAGTIQVSLEDLNTLMNEVVVVGYGTQKITKISGAISTVKGADIERLKQLELRMLYKEEPLV